MNWYRKASLETDYQLAVRNKDWEKAKQLVATQAKEKGYTIGPVYHGTKQYKHRAPEEVVKDILESNTSNAMSFTEFNTEGKVEPGAFFTTDPQFSKLYGLHKAIFFLRPEPQDIVRERWKTNTEYGVFDKSQIKSADPVTYDNDGKPIPLALRFDRSNPDIRY